MSQPIRILQVVGAMNRGGIETWLMHVLRHIDRERFQMDFLVHTIEPAAYDEEILSLGGQIHRIGNTRKVGSYAFQLNTILRKFGPYRVIHSHAYYFSAIPIAVAAANGIPVRIAHFHPLYDMKPHSMIRRLYLSGSSWLLSRFATCILANTYATRDSILQSFQGTHPPIDVLYCGLDLSRFHRPVDRVRIRTEMGLPIEQPLVVYVARFTSHKNHRQALRIVDAWRDIGFHAHMVFAGSHGELQDDLVKSASTRNNITVFCGLEDISDLLLASDLFFFPSLHEGFGLVAVEAQAAQLPVVATSLPTIREACAPQLHPYLFPADDDDSALTNLSTILQDDSLRSSLGIFGKHWAARFDIDRTIAELTKLYEASEGSGVKL